MKFWRGLSGQLIILIVGMTAILLLLGGGLLMALAYQNDRDAAIDRQRETTQRLADALATTLQHYQAVLDLAAHALIIDSNALEVQLSSITSTYPEFQEIIVWDQAGQVVGQWILDEQEALIDDHKDLLFEMAQNAIHVSDVVGEEDAFHIILVEPLQIEDELVGIIAARFPMQILWDATMSMGIDNIDSAYLINKDRAVGAHTNLNVRRHRQLDNLVEEGGIYTSQNGEAVVGAARAIEGTAWKAVTELSAAEAVYRSSAERGRIWMLYLVIMLAVATGFGWLLARRIVAPLRELNRGVQHISSGDLDFRLNLNRPDEIGQLSQAFDQMADQLADRTEELLVLNLSLEARVATRTKALQEANDRMEAIAEALYHTSQKANAASQAKSQFLANMSHELRTPLNSMIIYHDLLLREVYGELTDRQRDRLTKSRESARLLLQLINDILDLSKIEAGEMEIKRDLLNLHPILKAGAEMVAPLIRSDKVEFRQEIPEVLPPIVGDEQRIKQILLNLLSNAAKFTSEGEIVLWASVVFTPTDVVIPGMPDVPDGDWLVISIKDTGIGIPEDMHETIFQEFKQVDESNTRKYGGTGLGLTICKKLVELQGGYIGLDSAPGVGSAFTFTLPVTPRPE